MTTNEIREMAVTSVGPRAISAICDHIDAIEAKLDAAPRSHWTDPQPQGRAMLILAPGRPGR